MPLMFSKPALRWFYITLGIVGVIYVVYLSQATLILLGISFVVAYLLDPSVDRLERLGLSRTLAISLLTAVGLGSMGILFLVMWLDVPHTGASGSMTISPPSWRRQHRRCPSTSVLRLISTVFGRMPGTYGTG